MPMPETANQPAKPAQAKSERQNLLARIHIGRKQRGLNDGEYEAIVQSFSGDGHLSCAALTLVELRSLAAYLAPPASKQGRGEARPAKGMATHKQRTYIYALWQHTAHHTTESVLNRWLAKHWKTSSLAFLTSSQAHKIISVLEKWKNKNEK